MQITIIKEMLPGEHRVAIIPDSVKKLVALGLSVAIESEAGINAGFSDAEYISAGATVHQNRSGLLSRADILAVVNRPEEASTQELKKGSIIIGMLKPLDDPSGLAPYATAGMTAIALELIPRITRAQSMDVLSSMATIVGYKAVIMAATTTSKMFPMLMTAAGTIPPAKVLILGAGVAGLQAIATARRLGAVVEAYDVRAAAGEQVRSLGAIFLEVDLGGIQTEDAGGYAKELSEEALLRGRQLVAKHAKTADVIITTAQVPGRRAPLLLTSEAIAEMKSGAVVIDLAGASGGNCALSKPGEEVISPNGVIIQAPLNVAATVPLHASQLYSRNLLSLLQLMIRDGKIHLDLQDEIIKQSCVIHDGVIVNLRLKGLLEVEASSQESAQEPLTVR